MGGVKKTCFILQWNRSLSEFIKPWNEILSYAFSYIFLPAVSRILYYYRYQIMYNLGWSNLKINWALGKLSEIVLGTQFQNFTP